MFGDAFAYVFSVFAKLVNFLFDEAVTISYKTHTVSVGYVLIAISVLSLVIGSVLAFSGGRARFEGYRSSHSGVDHMAHTVNEYFRSKK